MTMAEKSIFDSAEEDKTIIRQLRRCAREYNDLIKNLPIDGIAATPNEIIKRINVEEEGKSRNITLKEYWEVKAFADERSEDIFIRDDIEGGEIIDGHFFPRN